MHWHVFVMSNARIMFQLAVFAAGLSVCCIDCVLYALRVSTLAFFRLALFSPFNVPHRPCTDPTLSPTAGRLVPSALCSLVWSRRDRPPIAGQGRGQGGHS